MVSSHTDMAKNCCRYFTVSLVPVASFILAILFGCGVIVLPILYADLVKDYVYGAVIDAGSSHTTLYIYRWQVPTMTLTHSTTGNVEEVFKCPLNRAETTSVNSYTSNPGNVSQAFAGCLEKSYQYYFDDPVVPETQRQYTPIYLGATAGMRLVRKANVTVSQEIMDNIEKALKNSTISKYQYGNSTILPGSTEASSAWVSANYLNNNQTTFQASYHTIGSLDLGGASTQIAFESNATFAKDYQKNETLFGRTYHIYARSFLCYGENEAYSRYLAYLIKQHGDSPRNISNPCLFRGATVTVNSSQIYTPCTSNSTAIEVFGYQFTPLRSAENYTFQGTSNAYLCGEYIRDVFGNFSNNSTTYTPPPVKGHFVGFSGLYYTVRFFNGTGNVTYTPKLGWQALQSTISAFCNLTKSQAEVRKDSYLNTRCFDGQFVTFLLENGFGFSEKTQNWSVEFKEKLDKTTLGWALGFILEKTNEISQKHFSRVRPYTTVDLVVGMIILSILCVIFVIFFALTFYACKKAIGTRSGYQNI